MTALAMNGMAGVSFLIEEALLPLTVEALGPLMSGASAANLSPSASTTTAPRKGRDTKRIGDISEARVLAALTEAGYVVSKPFGENARYDLVADDGAKLLRVQVKTGRLRNGVVLSSATVRISIEVGRTDRTSVRSSTWRSTAPRRAGSIGSPSRN